MLRKRGQRLFISRPQCLSHLTGALDKRVGIQCRQYGGRLLHEVLRWRIIVPGKRQPVLTGDMKGVITREL